MGDEPLYAVSAAVPCAQNLTPWTLCVQLEKSAGGGKKDPEGHREKEAMKNKKKKHGSKMGKSGTEETHVGAICLALELLTLELD